MNNLAVEIRHVLFSKQISDKERTIAWLVIDGSLRDPRHDPVLNVKPEIRRKAINTVS